MDTEQLEKICRTRRGKTILIKRLREVDPNMLSYKATQTIHQALHSTLSDKELYDKLAELLQIEDNSITKEQFMNMISNAIDHADCYYLDPLEAVHLLCENLEKQGGLRGVARKLNRFISAL